MLDDATGELLWETDTRDTPASFPGTYTVDAKQYIAVVVGQPSIHAGTYMGVMPTFTGARKGRSVHCNTAALRWLSAH